MVKRDRVDSLLHHGVLISHSIFPHSALRCLDVTLKFRHRRFAPGNITT